MKNALFVILFLFSFVKCCFAYKISPSKGTFFRDGNTEIVISHCNAIYSIAQYFDMIDKNSKYEPGPFAGHRYVPENDSIPFYSVDEYHNDLFKLTRKILYSDYDSIISYIKNTGLLDGSEVYRDSICKVLFFYEYSTEDICCKQQNKYSQKPYDSFNLTKQMSSLSDFAKIMHYDDFFEENYNVYYNYIIKKVPCLEDMRIWMNDMLGKNYERILFFTSPFSDIGFNVNDNVNKSTIVIYGGVNVSDKICDLTPDFGAFEALMWQHLFEHFSFEFEHDDPSLIMDNGFYEKITIAMYLIYCHDMQSEETFLNEKNMIYCKFKELIGPEFKEFSKDIDSIYQKLLMDRDFKEKNLLHLYFECWENLNVR